MLINTFLKEEADQSLHLQMRMGPRVETGQLLCSITEPRFSDMWSPSWSSELFVVEARAGWGSECLHICFLGGRCLMSTLLFL